ncbi:MAG: histidine phosphatase family protein, partial [Deinococcus sp.]|nr:histidine phosphatase family protein [Deinococcus sp.]
WLSELPGGRVIAFSHSIALRTLLRELLKLPLVPQPGYPIPYAERIGNGRFVTLERRGGVWRRAEPIPQR